jgi:uncharacterized membrane protein (DUF106 family)
MKAKITLIVALIISLVVDLKAQSSINKITAEPQKEIEAVNNKIEQFYQSENADSLTSLYTEQLTYFPEYKPAIFDTKNLVVGKKV